MITLLADVLYTGSKNPTPWAEKITAISPEGITRIEVADETSFVPWSELVSFDIQAVAE